MASVTKEKTGHRGHVTAARGQQSGAVGRQIKYWILCTVKRLLYSKRSESNGCLLVTGYQRTRVLKDTKSNLNNVTSMKSFQPPLRPLPSVTLRVMCGWVECLASSWTSCASCTASFPLSLTDVIATSVNWAGLFKNVQEVSDFQDFKY